MYDQIRKRVSQLYGGNYPHPQLFGISALGTRFCVYEYSTPLGRSHRVLTLNPTLLPTLRLRRDGILEPQGEARLKQVVRHINFEEMGWLPVPHVSLDFLTLRAQRSDWELILKCHTVSLYLICTNFKCTEYSSCWLTLLALLSLPTLFLSANLQSRQPQRLTINPGSPASTDYIASPYDAHNYSLHPRSRFPSISAN